METIYLKQYFIQNGGPGSGNFAPGQGRGVGKPGSGGTSSKSSSIKTKAESLKKSVKKDLSNIKDLAKYRYDEEPRRSKGGQSKAAQFQYEEDMAAYESYQGLVRKLDDIDFKFGRDNRDLDNKKDAISILRESRLIAYYAKQLLGKGGLKRQADFAKSSRKDSYREKTIKLAEEVEKIRSKYQDFSNELEQKHNLKEGNY